MKKGNKKKNDFKEKDAYPKFSAEDVIAMVGNQEDCHGDDERNYG